MSVGDSVYIPELMLTGVLLDKLNRERKVRVQVKKRIVRVDKKKLERVSSLKKENFRQTAKIKVGNIKFHKNENLVINLCCDLHGCRADEVEERVVQYLDRAVLRNFDKVHLIHGYGNGVLRNKIRNLLLESPYVVSFYPAGINKGGNGVTIVELKK